MSVASGVTDELPKLDETAFRTAVARSLVNVRTIVSSAASVQSLSDVHLPYTSKFDTVEGAVRSFGLAALATLTALGVDATVLDTAAAERRSVTLRLDARNVLDAQDKHVIQEKQSYWSNEAGRFGSCA